RRLCRDRTSGAVHLYRSGNADRRREAQLLPAGRQLGARGGDSRVHGGGFGLAAALTVSARSASVGAGPSEKTTSFVPIGRSGRPWPPAAIATICRAPPSASSSFVKINGVARALAGRRAFHSSRPSRVANARK